MALAARRAGSAMLSMFLRCLVILLETTRGRIDSESRDTMMKTTGTIVVHVLSGPTRQMLRRSLGLDGINQFLAISSPDLGGQGQQRSCLTASYIFRPYAAR